VTTTITVTTKRQVVLPKAMCERKKIRPGTSLRISEVGDGFYVTPVPEPTEAELAEVFKALDRGRRTRPITDEDESQILLSRNRSSVNLAGLHGVAPTQEVGVGQIGSHSGDGARLNQGAELEIDGVHITGAAGEMPEAGVSIAAP